MDSQTSRLPLSQSDLSLLIERLVNAIERTNGSAPNTSKINPAYDQIRTTKVWQHFRDIVKIVRLFDPRYACDFSEHLLVFRRACRYIGLELSPVGLTCLSDDETRYLSSYEARNMLIERIRVLTGSTGFQRRKADRRFQAKDQRRKIAHYVDNVMDRYSRTVVVRIDLHYLSSTQARQRVEDVFADQDRLSREIGRNPMFEDLTGHICSIEQGQEKGYHIHAAFFFNGAKVRSDFHKARQIGELWKRITDGQGYYYSCNDDKGRYGNDLGIGVIKRDDDLARSNLHKAMSYLAKDAQHLRMKPEGARCLRKGVLRTLPVPKLSL